MNQCSELEQALADLLSAREGLVNMRNQRDAAAILLATTEADLKLAREELATLKAENRQLTSDLYVVSVERNDAKEANEMNAKWCDELAVENSRLQPYVQHPAYCRIWTRRCSVPIIENGVVRGMRSPTKDEIEAVTCNCGLLPLQPEQKKGART